MIRPLCPTERLEDPADLESVLDRAFARMATGRPGPVHIEMPTDVMPLACPAIPRASQPIRPAPDAGQISTGGPPA